MSCWRGMAQAYPRHVYLLDSAEVGLCLIVAIELAECFTEAVRKLETFMSQRIQTRANYDLAA